MKFVKNAVPSFDKQWVTGSRENKYKKKGHSRMPTNALSENFGHNLVTILRLTCKPIFATSCITRVSEGIRTPGPQNHNPNNKGR